MFTWVQFLIGPSAHDWLLGSDGVYPLDGRWATRRCIQAASERAFRLNTNLNKGIIAFQFMRGERYSTSRPISGIIKLKAIPELLRSS